MVPVTEHKYPNLPLNSGAAWRALTALCIGFFMILLDQSIVAVATPDLQSQLGATYNQVIWVTSVYLLFFAVRYWSPDGWGIATARRTFTSWAW